MSSPNDRRYSKTHEWAMLKDGIVYVGITDHAQEQLGDIVHVELPKRGKQAVAGQPVAEIESVKSASDIYSPVSGEVVQVNGALNDDPAVVNSSPHDDAWMFAVKPSNLDEYEALLDAAAYDATY